MAQSRNKTRSKEISPTDFIATVTPEQKKADCKILLELFNKATGLKPKMCTPTAIGYGGYHYKYESGREGDSVLTAFCPRKQNLTIYIMPGFRIGKMPDHLGRLGKHKIGSSCLYINKLADVDTKVLAEIVQDGVAHMREKYETWDE